MKNKENKILFIINEYSSSSGQHLFHVIHLIEQIAKQGVEVGLIIEKCNGDPPLIGYNVKVSAQKQKKGFKRVVELHNLIKDYIDDGYERIFIRISTKAATNAIITTKMAGKGETYFWFSGANLDLDKDNSIVKRMMHFLRSGAFYNFSVKYCTYFVTGPEKMVEYYHKEAHIPYDKIKLLYNDIDLDRFKPVDEKEKKNIRDELGLKKNYIYVLFVHRFSPVRKSGYYLPYILENISADNVRFLFIGSGPEENEIRLCFEKLGRDDCIFLGSKPNNEIQLYYQACDLFINPSYCEGFPRVIIEAMACGLPIVTTAAGGTSDLLGTFQQRYVVNIDDRDLFKNRIEELILDESKRETCISENLNYVRKYSTENVSKMYINAILGDN